MQCRGTISLARIAGSFGSCVRTPTMNRMIQGRMMVWRRKATLYTWYIHNRVMGKEWATEWPTMNENGMIRGNVPFYRVDGIRYGSILSASHISALPSKWRRAIDDTFTTESWNRMTKVKRHHCPRWSHNIHVVQWGPDKSIMGCSWMRSQTSALLLPPQFWTSIVERQERSITVVRLPESVTIARRSL